MLFKPFKSQKEVNIYLTACVFSAVIIYPVFEYGWIINLLGLKGVMLTKSLSAYKYLWHNSKTPAVLIWMWTLVKFTKTLNIEWFKYLGAFIIDTLSVLAFNITRDKTQLNTKLLIGFIIIAGWFFLKMYIFKFHKGLSKYKIFKY